MKSNQKEQPSAVKPAWEAPQIIDLGAEQTEGKSTGGGETPTFGDAGPS